RQGGIAQPAIAIVPVAYPAEFFRQGCSWGCDDATSRRVREGFEGYQRPANGTKPLALHRAACTPLPPERFGIAQGTQWVNVRRLIEMRQRVRQHKRHALAFFDLVAGSVRKIAALHWYRRAQHDLVWTGHGADRIARQASNP